MNMTTSIHKNLLLGACVSTLLATAAGSALAAGELTCAENRITKAHMCFLNAKVTANEEVRSAPFFKGGPKGVKDTGFTARVHCTSKILELTDRQGVAFVRNRPTEQVGIDFVQFLCEHKTVKRDPKLSTK